MLFIKEETRSVSNAGGLWSDERQRSDRGREMSAAEFSNIVGPTIILPE